jgi:hypothetical protein
MFFNGTFIADETIIGIGPIQVEPDFISMTFFLYYYVITKHSSVKIGSEVYNQGKIDPKISRFESEYVWKAEAICRRFNSSPSENVMKLKKSLIDQNGLEEEMSFE